METLAIRDWSIGAAGKLLGAHFLRLGAPAAATPANDNFDDDPPPGASARVPVFPATLQGEDADEWRDRRPGQRGRRLAGSRRGAAA